MKRLLLLLTFVGCATLATWLAPAFESIESQAGTSVSPLMALVGDSRELFANQFFVMADVYFHSGFYPTIFDNQKTGEPNHLDVASHDEAAEKNGKKAEPDEDDNFLGTPIDGIEEFGRHFFPTVHTHLHGAKAGEILPWLKLSADMDPKRIDTYVTAAYWLRNDLNKPEEAAEFLRQGLRANPDSPEILLELGRVYEYNKKDTFVARNLWDEGLRKWDGQSAKGSNPDPHVREQLWGEIVRQDQQTGNLRQELRDLEAWAQIEPGRTGIQDRIKEIKAKLAH